MDPQTSPPSLSRLRPFPELPTFRCSTLPPLPAATLTRPPRPAPDRLAPPTTWPRPVEDRTKPRRPPLGALRSRRLPSLPAPWRTRWIAGFRQIGRNGSEPLASPGQQKRCPMRTSCGASQDAEEPALRERAAPLPRACARVHATTCGGAGLVEAGPDGGGTSDAQIGCGAGPGGGGAFAALVVSGAQRTLFSRQT